MESPRKKALQFGVVALLAVVALPIVFGHSSEIIEHGIDDVLHEWSFNIVGISIVLLLGTAYYAVKKNSRKPNEKKIQFGVLVTIAVLSTLFLAGSTIYLNGISPTGGPVHWHTDFEIWNCGTELDLIDPTGISNHVGSWAVHEHNDDRMHIEGTPIDMKQASFHYFFEVIGGEVDPVGMTYPTNNGIVTMPKSGSCNGQPAQLQVFLYHVTNPEETKHWNYTQTKLPYPQGLDTVMAHYGSVPPGDCLIVEYGPVKQKTEHICSSYKYAQARGELNGR